MKVYSDTITRADLFDCLPGDVSAEVIEIRHARKRAHGFTVSLEGIGDRHYRRKNGGNYGASSPGVMAATWDDHGVWMARLYELDPDALIADYAGRDDFERQTREYRDYVQTYNKPTSKRWAEHLAPWLDKREPCVCAGTGNHEGQPVDSCDECDGGDRA